MQGVERKIRKGEVSDCGRVSLGGNLPHFKTGPDREEQK